MTFRVNGIIENLPKLPRYSRPPSDHALQELRTVIRLQFIRLASFSSKGSSASFKPIIHPPSVKIYNFLWSYAQVLLLNWTSGSIRPIFYATEYTQSVHQPISKSIWLTLPMIFEMWFRTNQVEQNQLIV